MPDAMIPRSGDLAVPAQDCREIVEKSLKRIARPASLIALSLWLAACSTTDRVSEPPPTSLFLPDAGRLVLAGPPPEDAVSLRPNRLRLGEGWSGREPR